jgi:hypothetical protein
MMDDEGCTVFGKDVFKEPVEENISVSFLQCFTIIPRGRANKTVVRPLIPAVKEVAPKAVLQAAQGFDALHDIRHGDTFTEILKQPIAK